MNVKETVEIKLRVDKNSLADRLAEADRLRQMYDFDAGREMELQPLRTKLDNINHALRRIGEGKFGVCQTCGEQIPDERMLAEPTASLCVKCKNRRIHGIVKNGYGYQPRYYSTKGDRNVVQS